MNKGLSKRLDPSLRVLISDEQTKETDGNIGSAVNKGVSQKPYFVIANEVKQSGKGW
jgi:hypothetical protein